MSGAKSPTLRIAHHRIPEPKCEKGHPKHAVGSVTTRGEKGGLACSCRAQVGGEGHPHKGGTDVRCQSPGQVKRVSTSGERFREQAQSLGGVKGHLVGEGGDSERNGKIGYIQGD